MGVAIKCILDRELPGLAWMEGKCLAAAWCGQPGDADPDPSGSTADIITLDFGGPKSQPPAGVDEPLLGPLDKFIAGDGGS